MNNNESNLMTTLFRTTLTIILLAASAWGAWVSSSIQKHSDMLGEVRTEIAVIKTLLDDIHKDVHGQRHN